VTRAAKDAAQGIAHPLRLEQYRTTLRDGTPVLVRPIRPDDKELIRQGFDRLSPASRYRRFLSPVDELSDAELRYLTEIDYVDHFAWAALRADRPNEGIGVARYIRLKEEPEVAEAAVTVLDEYQGKGLGTFMYKTAINNLVSSGWKVQSDTVRSPQANRVWLNLRQRNPDTVKVIPRLGGSTVYEASGVVLRRPNVKRHQRRSR